VRFILARLSCRRSRLISCSISSTVAFSPHGSGWYVNQAFGADTNGLNRHEGAFFNDQSNSVAFEIIPKPPGTRILHLQPFHGTLQFVH
jgi:hypothetical protein